MMDVLCLLHVVYKNRYVGDYMVPYHNIAPSRRRHAQKAKVWGRFI